MLLIVQLSQIRIDKNHFRPHANQHAANVTYGAAVKEDESHAASACLAYPEKCHR